MKSVIRATALSVALALLTLPVCRAMAASPGDEPGAVERSAIDAVGAVLDDFHRAASEADEEGYLGRIAETGVFLGTDASERWTREEFREFVHPYFARGQGWTYTPTERHVALSADGTVAWFDELLDSASYGTCRGTGVLALEDGVWTIEQYSLSIPIPNELAKAVVEKIRAVE